jgi:hypothetical protein
MAYRCVATLHMNTRVSMLSQLPLHWRWICQQLVQHNDHFAQYSSAQVLVCPFKTCRTADSILLSSIPSIFLLLCQSHYLLPHLVSKLTNKKILYVLDPIVKNLSYIIGDIVTLDGWIESTRVSKYNFVSGIA